MEYFRHIQLNAHLIRIIGLDETCFYLVNGSEKTVLLDAGSGYGDLKSYIEDNKLATHDEIDVIATHGHHDHIGGADSFNKIYMNHKDLKVFKEFGTMESRLNYTHEFEERMGIKFADSMLPMTKCLRTTRSKASPSSMLNTSHSSATCMAGAPAYESQAMIYWPLRWAEITNSLPNSPEPNNKIFFINSFIYNFIYLRFDDVRCTIRVTLDNKPPQAKAIPIVHRKSSNSKSSYWCWSLNKSFTVFTGLNVVRGTSTNTVFQSLMAPFHKPGSSSAFRSLPFLDL